MGETIEEDPERCLIGAAILNAERVVPLGIRAGICARNFENACLRDAWETMQAMYGEKVQIDPFSVTDFAKRGGKALPSEEVEACINACPTAAHAEYYIDAVRDRTLGRELRAIATEVMRGVGEGNGSQMVFDTLLKKIKSVESAAYCGNEWVNLEALTEEIEQEWQVCGEERLVKKNLGYINGVPLPWECLNRVYVGLKPGLHILAARPGEGKTTALVNCSEFWDEIGMKHAVVSIDMPASQLFRRYGCSSARTSLPKLDWGARTEEIERTTKKMREIARRGNMLLTEADRIDRIVSALCEAVHRSKARIGVIDYLQIVDGTEEGRRSMERRDEIGKVVRALKAQANKHLKIPIVLLCQLNRDVAKEGLKDENRMPTLTDLGDSGEIERAASSVTLLHVDKPTQAQWDLVPPVDLAYGYDYLAKTLRPLWWIVAKQQNGARKDIPFIMYPNYFMLRPGDYSAKKVEEEVPNTKRKVMRNYAFFQRVRDDWRVLKEDAHLEKKGILGPRAFGDV